MALHRQEFENELEAIEAQVIELFAMVAEDLPRATEALLTGNGEVVRELAERDQAKRRRDFGRADAIRKELTAKGIVIEDSKDGVRWKRK